MSVYISVKQDYNKNYIVIGGTVKVRLVPQEHTVLWYLMCHKLMIYADVAEVLWPDCEVMPDTWCDIIRLTAHRLKVKLRGSGWTIRARWGIGYYLEEE